MVLTVFAVVSGIAVMMSPPIAGAAAQAPVPPDYYVVGDLNGQNGWDGGIVSGNPVPFTNNNANSNVITTEDAMTGDQAWRYGGSYGSPGAGTPFTPDLGVSVGAPNATAFGSPEVPDGDRSVVSLAFTANAPGDGSAISIYEGSILRTDRTGAHVVLRNDTSMGNPPGTMSLSMSPLADDPDCFGVPTLIASVTPGDWHTLEMTTT